MNELLIAGILGIVEGLTEFLPVSSTGHLIIASNLLGASSERVQTFEVVIQLGAILAVVVLYWSRFWGLLVPQQKVRFSGMYGLYLLLLTSLPASLLGLCAHSFIKQYLFNPVSVGLSLAVGALFIIFAEKKTSTIQYATLDDMTPKLALSIGCFQCLSLWPGFSRSASTIMGGMLLGAKRELAAEYSFIAAVPIMFAATSYSLLKSYSALTMTDLPFFLVGVVVSFLSALAAIKIFIGLVSKISFMPFAVYRLLIAPLVIWLFY